MGFPIATQAQQLASKSMHAADRESDQIAERHGLGAEPGKGFLASSFEQARSIGRPFQSEQCGGTGPACCFILVQCLANNLGISDAVKHVVADLEQKAEVFCKAQKPLKFDSIAIAQLGTCLHRKAHQRTGLAKLTGEDILLGRPCRRIEIHHLATRQSILA